MNAVKEKAVLHGTCGMRGHRALALALFLLAALIALASGLAGPASASAKTPSAPPNRVWENCSGAIRLELRDINRSAQQESLAVIGQAHPSGIANMRKASGAAVGAAPIAVRLAEMPAAPRQKITHPVQPTANHFGRDPPVRLQLNPQYDGNPNYDSGQGLRLAAESAAGETTATGFRGSEGFELKNAPYQPVRNAAGEVNGQAYSGHAFDQMQNRGIMPSVVQNAIQTGSRFATRAGTAGYYDAVNSVRVIVNSQTGRVVTVIRGAP